MLPELINEPLWDERDLARYLKSSVPTERKRRMRGDGCPYVKIGASVRYIPAVARQFALEQMRHSTSEAPSEAQPVATEPATEPRKRRGRPSRAAAQGGH